jgi:hypothetical protein
VAGLTLLLEFGGGKPHLVTHQPRDLFVASLTNCPTGPPEVLRWWSNSILGHDHT